MHTKSIFCMFPLKSWKFMSISSPETISESKEIHGNRASIQRLIKQKTNLDSWVLPLQLPHPHLPID